MADADTRTNRDRRRIVAVIVGSVSLLGAVLVSSGVGTAGLDRFVAVILAYRVVVSLAAVAAGLFGLWALLAGTASDDPEIELPSREQSYYDGSYQVGDDVDVSLERLGDSESDGDAWRKSRVRREIYQLAVDVLVDARGCSREEAHALLEDGSWTDDPRASVFLAGADGDSLPLRTRIVDWASGEPYRRRVDATMEELAARSGVELGGETA